MKIPLPPNEDLRLEALRRYAILDTPPDPAFDRLTRLASRLLRTPIAIVSLIAEHRQWFKSCIGLDISETPRAVAFCAHTIMNTGLLMVTDTEQDPRFSANPLVTGPPGIRFYAGVPLMSRDGLPLGALSVLDVRPRLLTEEEQAILSDLASMAADEMELRLAILELQRLEHARQISESLKDAVFSAAELGICITDEDGIFVEVNPAYCRLFGYPEKELIGESFFKVLGPKEVGKAQRIHRAFFRRLTSSEGEWEATRSDGTAVHVYLTGHRFRGPDGRQFAVTTVTDLTEVKRMEEQLRQSDKMEAVGRLAGGIAHDFNNLLTIILGYGDVLRSELESHPAQMPVQELMRAAERAAALTTQLLAFSRQRPLKTEPLNLSHVVGEMEGMLRRLIGEHIELRTKLEPDLPPVQADRGQLEQIILNLAVNARDAMPGGGTLTIETSVLHHQGAGRCAALTVTDTGPGLSADARLRLFEPFFSTKQSGTGLGLATVYAIVKRFEGEITVLSEAGEGAMFRIYLPVSHAAAPKKLHAKPVLPRGDTLSILVAEDEPGVRGLLTRILTSHGHRVAAAASGEEALELWRSEQKFDLVITDIVMPGLSGIELGQAISADPGGVRVLYLSGYTDKVFENPLPDNYRPELLQKPFTAQQLLETIARVMRPPPG